MFASKYFLQIIRLSIESVKFQSCGQTTFNFVKCEGGRIHSLVAAHLNIHWIYCREIFTRNFHTKDFNSTIIDVANAKLICGSECLSLQIIYSCFLQTFIYFLSLHFSTEKIYCRQIFLPLKAIFFFKCLRESRDFYF